MLNVYIALEGLMKLLEVLSMKMINMWVCVKRLEVVHSMSAGVLFVPLLRKGSSTNKRH